MQRGASSIVLSARMPFRASVELCWLTFTLLRFDAQVNAFAARGEQSATHLNDRFGGTLTIYKGSRIAIRHRRDTAAALVTLIVPSLVCRTLFRRDQARRWAVRPHGFGPAAELAQNRYSASITVAAARFCEESVTNSQNNQAS
jgi:hypothetical protein